MQEEEVLGAIAEAFRGHEKGDWRAAAAELAARDDPGSFAAIDTALGASDANTRRAAIYVISLRGAGETGRLIEIARSSASATDRDYALNVLSYQAPSEAAEEAVIAASVLDPNPSVRLRTRHYLAYNLVGVHRRNPKPRLREFARHGRLRQRWRAVLALREVREHERLLTANQADE